MTNKLRRDVRIRLFDMGDYHFEVRSKEDDVLLDSNDDFLIYMKNVNFRNGNIIDGRYLGELSENSPLLDDKYTEVTTNGSNYYTNGEIVRTARLVAVDNKKKVIIIIGK